MLGDIALPPGAARAFLPAALPLCLWVAFSDLRVMKIRNTAVAGLFLTFMVLAPLVLPMPTVTARLLQGAGMLAVGITLSTVGAMGAGDAKFLAAAAPFVAPADASSVLALLAGTTLAAVATRRMVRSTPLWHLAPGWISWKAARFPMGLALGPTLASYLALAAI